VFIEKSRILGDNYIIAQRNRLGIPLPWKMTRCLQPQSHVRENASTVLRKFLKLTDKVEFLYNMNRYCVDF